MVNTKVASRYAKGLLKYAEENGITQTIFEESESLIELIKDSREIRNFLKTPILDLKTKIRVMNEILQSFSKPMQQFCELLFRHKREQFLASTLEAFVTLRNTGMGIRTAYITTAEKLSDTEYNAILDKLVDGERDKISLQKVVDPNILGGFLVRVGDKQIDQSISGKLKEIKKQFEDNLYRPKF